MTSETKPIKIPDAAHPITIDADPAQVTARVGTTVIADSANVVTLREASYPPVRYFPLDSVAAGVLRPSSTETYCPYKGDASYYDIVLPDGAVLADAVWSYRRPYPAVAPIAGHVAFYANRVQVETDRP